MDRMDQMDQMVQMVQMDRMDPTDLQVEISSIFYNFPISHF